MEKGAAPIPRGLRRYLVALPILILLFLVLVGVVGPSWALVGAGCSNQIQVAQGQGLFMNFCALVQAAIGCSCSY